MISLDPDSCVGSAQIDAEQVEGAGRLAVTATEVDHPYRRKLPMGIYRIRASEPPRPFEDLEMVDHDNNRLDISFG